MGKKIAILAGVGVVGFWFWVVANQWVHSDVKFALVSAWIGPLVAIVVASAVIAVAFLILPTFGWKWIVSWIVAAEFLLIFGATWLNAIACGVIILLTIYSIKIIEIEAWERTHLHMYLILRRGLSFVILPLLIAISFGYYQSPALVRRTQANIVSPTLEQVMSFTADTFLKSQGEALTARQQEEAQKQITNKSVQLLSYYANEYFPFLPPVLAFGMFLILWGLAYVFIYLSVLIGILLFWILRATKFVRIEIVNMPSEFIKL